MGPLGRHEIQRASFSRPIWQLLKVSNPDRWCPRVVVEAKLGSVTTHDAITTVKKLLHIGPFIQPDLTAIETLSNRIRRELESLDGLKIINDV